MILPKFSRALLSLLFVASLPLTALAAEPLQTETIKPQVGHKGISGVKVVSITPENDRWIKVALSLPKSSQEEGGAEQAIEEIVVVGRQDSGEIKQVKPYEVVNDLEEGRSGIVIYVDKLQDFALTINYTETQPDVIPDRVLER